MFEESDREVSTPVFVTPRAVQAAKNTDRKLIFIPFALILLRIWGTVRYVLFILENEKLCDDLKLSEKILMICQVSSIEVGFIARRNPLIMSCILTTLYCIRWPFSVCLLGLISIIFTDYRFSTYYLSSKWYNFWTDNRVGKFM